MKDDSMGLGAERAVAVGWDDAKKTPTVSPDTVQVHKNKDTVKWASTYPMEIAFQDGYKPGCNNAHTLCNSHAFSTTGTFKYSVTLTVNGTKYPLDPSVEVIP